MVLKERQNTPDRFVWECPADNCRKRRSVRAGSFFEASKIPLVQWLYNIFLWSIGKSNQRHSLLTELSLRTIVTLLDKICNICSMKILNGNFTLGGRGKTVEIDKSMFGNKPWMRFWGPVSIWNGRVRYWAKSSFSCSRSLTRDRGNQTSARVHWTWHREFSPYFNLNNVGYIHLMVNHYKNFVNPYTGAHCNTIEGLWGQVKRKLKVMNGTTRAKLESQIWLLAGDRFNHMLSHIAEIVPPN